MRWVKNRKYDIILGFLLLLNILLSLYLTTSYSSNIDFCLKSSSCDDVRNSAYGSIFGIKLAWFGVICFVALFLLYLIARFNKKYYWTFFLSSLIGFIFAVYFIYLQIFVLKKICNNCVIIDSIAIMVFLIVIFEYLAFKKEIFSLEKNMEKVEERLLEKL
jgi:uncharacterized membrane protein